MGRVLYTPMLKKYLAKVLPLVEQMSQENANKSKQPLDPEATTMFEYIRAIQRTTRYGNAFKTPLQGVLAVFTGEGFPENIQIFTCFCLLLSSPAHIFNQY